MTHNPRQSSATREMRGNVIHKEDSPIIFDYVTANGPDGINFDVWFASSHLPSLIQYHSRDALRCYAVPARSSYLSIIELNGTQDISTLDANDQIVPASVARWEHFFGEPLGITQRRDTSSKECLENHMAYPALLNVPNEKMEEIGRWYEEEHLPLLMGCKEWQMTRRFKIRSSAGIGFTHLAIHYLKDIKALISPERDAARNTPWRDALIHEGWFAPEYRICYPMKRLPF